MDLNLLFIALRQEDWRNIAQESSLKPTSFEYADGYIRSFAGNKAEDIINHYFDKSDNVLLLVLDPLRIQSPIKKIKEDGFEFVAIQGEIAIDTIIDKIKLKSSKDGTFSINVKHFD
ncbi:DUF952 domain-containing protein [Gracilimonas sp.]|uniref:DUF952 domain-containing protein n=1 Tax=Gracilimonas sp. TaxID=1974203 RepID=UPI002870B9CE|nr:DUF952 domain-containing protein [Gracilimonas sp.]